MHPRLSRLLVILPLLSCVQSSSVPAEATIDCVSDSDCPGGWLCHPRFNRCREPGFDDSSLPAPEVVFLSPADGAGDVPVEIALLLVLSQDVSDEALTDASRLIDDSGSEVALTARLIDGRTFELEPSALNHDTHYTLTVENTLKSLAGVNASTTFSAEFTTALPPDRIAPNPVADIFVDNNRNATDDPIVTVTWTNPADDFAGVLVLRREGAQVSETLVSQMRYEVGKILPGGAVVMASSTQTQHSDLLENDGAYQYAIAAYDTERNYAEPTPAPFVTDEALRWCPDGTARLLVSGPSTGELRALVGSNPATLNLDQSETWPISGEAITDELTIPSGAFTLGTDTLVRTVVTTSEGTYVGRPVALTAYPGTLTALQEPLPVGPNASTRYVLDTGPWTGFEGEVDTDFNAGTETWTSTSTAVGSGSVTLEGSFADRGRYRFRIRPTAVDCGAAPWTTSEPANVGDWLYVSASAAPGGTGYGPNSPLNDFSDALDQALADGLVEPEIFIAEGEYSEPDVALTMNLRLLGGWNSDFSTRDPDATPSVIALVGPGFYAGRFHVPSGFGIDDRTVFDGITLERRTTSGNAPDNYTLVVAAPITVRDSEITTLIPGYSGGGLGTVRVSYADVRFEGTTIEGIMGNGSGGSWGLEIGGTSNVVVEGSTIHGGIANNGGSGISVGANSHLTLLDSSVYGGDIGNNQVRYGINSSGSMLAQDNIIDAGSGAAGSGQGIYLQGGAAELVSNRIYAAGFASSDGIWVRTTNEVLLTNNIVVAGSTAVRFGDGSPNYDARLLHNVLLAIGSNNIVAMRYAGPATTVINNIFGTLSTATNGTAISGAPFGYEPAWVENNVFISAPTKSYEPSAGDDSVDALNAMNGSTLPSPPGCSTSCDTFTAMGNVYAGALFSEVFENWDGADNDPRTWEDNDYRLRAAVDSTLGVCLSTTHPCGTASAPLECGVVIDDIDGSARSCDAGTGSSPGPHEMTE